MGFWVCQFSLGMEMSALSMFTLRTRGISATGSLKIVDFERPSLWDVDFFIDGKSLGAYCFVKSLDAQNFGRDSFFNKTRNFIFGLDVWILVKFGKFSFLNGQIVLQEASSSSGLSGSLWTYWISY
ncbi:unnamed protein product [Rhizophagus irregularis]|nr:unnamed protein product [Rhizophagus irregularis]